MVQHYYVSGTSKNAVSVAPTRKTAAKPKKQPKQKLKSKRRK